MTDLAQQAREHAEDLRNLTFDAVANFLDHLAGLMSLDDEGVREELAKRLLSARISGVYLHEILMLHVADEGLACFDIADALLPLILAQRAQAAERVIAEWMIAHSYATGHGDTAADMLAELVSQAAAQATERAWQPIETAPKDDELIFAYCPPDEEFPEGRVMMWRASMLAHQRANFTPRHLRFPATHWMPLPAPPAAIRNTKED